MTQNRITLAVGMALYLLVTVSAILQQVILVPVFSSYWGDDLYGSWLIMFSVANLLILADFGLNPFTYNRLQNYLASDTRDSLMLQRAVANSVFAYGVIFLSILIVLPLATFLLPIPNILGLSGTSDVELRTAFLTTMFGSACTIPIVGMSAVLRATNRINYISGVRIQTAVVSTILMFLAIREGFGIVGVAGAFAAANFIEMLIMFFVLTPKALEEFKQSRIAMRDEPLARTLKQAGRYIVPVSGDIVVQSIPTFAMGTMGTPSTGVVIYTLARVVTSCVRQIAVTVMFALSTSIGYAWTRQRRETAAAAVLTSLAIVGAGMGAASGYVWAYHAQLVTVWTGGAYQADSAVFALLLANVIAAYPSVIAWHALLYIGEPLAVTRTKTIQIAALCVLCFVVGSAFGVRGIAASVLASELCAVSIPLALELMKRFPISLSRLLTMTVLPTVSMFIVSYVCAGMAQRVTPPIDAGSFGISSAIWLPIPLAATLVVFYFATRPREH